MNTTTTIHSIRDTSSSRRLNFDAHTEVISRTNIDSHGNTQSISLDRYLN